MSILFSFCLYFTSFLPLWVAVVFQDIVSITYNKENIGTEVFSIIIICVIFIISLIVMYYKLFKSMNDTKTTWTIKEATINKSITLEYMLSVVLPLIAFDFTKWTQVVLFIIFYSTVCFLSISHKSFNPNIVLILLKYKFYNCVLENEDGKQKSTIVFSTNILTNEVNKPVSLKDINDDFSIDMNMKP